MPKQTFFNLPEEKRERIIRLAIEEFAVHDYDLASISRIVTKANIAKGSFYQYFEDKRDLYLYLVELASSEKNALLHGQKPPDSQMGLFETIRWLFSINLRFQFTHPHLNRVAYRALYGNNPLRIETMALLKENAASYYRDLIRRGIEQGDLDPELDADLAAFILGAVFNEFGDYLLKELEVDLLSLIDEQIPTDAYEKMMGEVDKLLEILNKGLGYH